MSKTLKNHNIKQSNILGANIYTLIELHNCFKCLSAVLTTLVLESLYPCQNKTTTFFNLELLCSFYEQVPDDRLSSHQSKPRTDGVASSLTCLLSRRRKLTSAAPPLIPSPQCGRSVSLLNLLTPSHQIITERQLSSIPRLH